MLSDVGDEGERVFWTSNLYFFIKENWIFAMTRRYAESNIELLLLTRNIPMTVVSDSEAIL